MQITNRNKLINKLKCAVHEKELHEAHLEALRVDFCEETHSKLQEIGSSFLDTPLTPKLGNIEFNVHGRKLDTHILKLSCDILSICISPHSLEDNDAVTGILKVTLDSPDHPSSPMEFYLHWRTKTYPKSDWVIVQAGKAPTVFTDEVFCERVLTFIS